MRIILFNFSQLISFLQIIIIIIYFIHINLNMVRTERLHAHILKTLKFFFLTNFRITFHICNSLICNPHNNSYYSIVYNLQK